MVSFAPTNSFTRDIAHRIDELLSSSIEEEEKSLGYYTQPARIIAEYVADSDPFGAKEWKQYFGVDVGDEPPFEEGFDQWWNGPDPLDVYDKFPDPPRQVRQTHLPPILGPKFITTQNGTLYGRSLKTLQNLGLKFSPTIFFEDFKNLAAGPSCWLVMRKEVICKGWLNKTGAINQVNEKTGAGYESLPSLIDLATVIFAYHKMHKVHYLGNERGVEKTRTYSLVKERSVKPNENLAIGNFSDDEGVTVRNAYFSYYENISLGCALLKKC